MISVTQSQLASFVPYAVTHDFFILGELHGIEQNAEIIHALLDALVQRHEWVTIAFEWVLSEVEATELQLFLHGEIDEIKSPDFFFDSDGRVTASHVGLLQHIRALNQIRPQSISVRTFDSKDNANEATLSQILEQVRREVAGPLIVETGVVHASKQPNDLPRSAAQALAASHTVFSVFIQYETGMVNVEGELLNVRDSESQRMGPGTSFDAIVVVPLATPATDPIPAVITSG